jgi:hypothetical protein
MTDKKKKENLMQQIPSNVLDETQEHPRSSQYLKNLEKTLKEFETHLKSKKNKKEDKKK